jgi:hypothetical protein
LNESAPSACGPWRSSQSSRGESIEPCGGATFTLKSDANFSNVGQFVVPSFGTHSANVFCTTKGDTLGPATGSSASGSLNVPAVAADGRTPADISITLGGQIRRGPIAGDVNGNASYTGRVTVNWVSGGVQQNGFTINAAEDPSNPGGAVSTPIDRVLNIKAPGFVEITWNLDAACQARGKDERAVEEAETAGGSLSLTYALRR